MKYYSEDHEWVEIIGDEAVVGLSEYAFDQDTDVLAVELPEEETDFIIGDKFVDVQLESGETMELYSPISGTVIAVNELLQDEPAQLLDSNEERCWICRLSNIDIDEVNDMMNEDTYFRYLRKLGKV